MKNTKRIQLNNVYNELVTIEPIEYDVAIKVYELMEEKSLLLNDIKKLFVKLFDSMEDIQENKELKKLQDDRDKISLEETEIRNKYNYYYCGLDNLHQKDKEYLSKKYPRKEFN